MIKIMSDSTCDLSPELLQKYNIDILPLYIHMGDKEYKDGAGISSDDLYVWSDKENATPKTSAPSLKDAMDILKPYATKGEKEGEVIIFSISEQMSSCFSVIKTAVSGLGMEKKVSVIDSMNLSTGVGLLVIRAAIMAKEGFTSQEITEEIKRLRPLVRASFVVDTLVYLHRGGRCSATAKLFGTMLKLKPEIVVENGKMDASKKYRGKIDRVIMDYVKDLEPKLKNAYEDRVFITHSGCDENVVEAVKKYLQSLGIFKEILVTRAGCVISSHCGPGTLGVLFIEKQD